MRESSAPSVLYPEVLSDASLGRFQGVFRQPLDWRKTYRLVLPLLALALLPEVLSGQHDAFDRLALPMLGAGVLAAMLGMFWWRWSALTLNTFLLAGGWLYLLGRLGFVLLGMPERLHLPGVSGELVWVPVLLGMHDWLLGPRWGRRLSVLTFGTFLFELAAHLVRVQHAWHSPELNTLLQVAAASFILLRVQQAGLARLREDARRGGSSALLTEHRDTLTGLPDQHAIEALLSPGQARQLRGLVVAVVGLDHQAEISEQYGATFMAHLQVHVGRVLLETLRDEDVVGHLGHGEFAVLLRTPDRRAARAACERLRVRVASRPLDGVNPTVNIGVAFYDDQDNGVDLLQAARQALAELRAQGVNRVRLAEHDEHGPLPVPA